MSDKDDKRLMQCLLIACAFVLVLLYLFFTKGACWEMKYPKLSYAIKILIFISFVCVCVSAFICIWNSDKTNDEKTTTTIFFCENKSFFYIAENCLQIPSTAEKVVVRNVNDLEKIPTDKITIKDIYILNPTGKISSEILAKFGGAKIHFCKMGDTFCIEKIIDNDATKNK